MMLNKRDYILQNDALRHNVPHGIHFIFSMFIYCILPLSFFFLKKNAMMNEQKHDLDTCNVIKYSEVYQHSKNTGIITATFIVRNIIFANITYRFNYSLCKKHTGT